MALARCKICGNPKDTKQSYPHCHIPEVESGTQLHRILCAAPNCTRVALIWLTDEEEERYRQGLRVFTIIRHQQVRVK